jgi:hypothetical protein
MGNSKKIEITDAESKVTYEMDFSDANISITGNVSIKPKETTEPEPTLEECRQGPEPKKITKVTNTSLLLTWHGEEVYGWDWWILQGSTRVAEGKIKPEGNQVTILYSPLSQGDYVFVMQGNTCRSNPKELPFTVPKVSSGGGTTNPGNGGSNPPPVSQKGRKFQIIMGTTGSGFQAKAEHGIDPQWVSRINASIFSWGSGISGICLWVPWDGYEEKPGEYHEEAFKRAIKFCKDRGLTLSVAFMRRRKKWDGFINDDEIITGSGGTKYYEGVPEFNPNVYAGYANERVNKLSSGAIKSIARLMKTYDKSFYMALAGGGAGEQVNYVWQNKKGIWESGDHSADNLRRFNAWKAPRGISNSTGRPPVIQGPGIDWPHPDFNNEDGLEFARFTTYGLRVALDMFIDDVKSEAPDIPCAYFYSVTSNRQMRAIANPIIGWIAERADMLYGSDGDGPGDLYAKVKVNSLNLGTFPDKISSAEVDPDDMSPARNNKGRMPEYGEGGLLYDNFLQLARTLFARGLQVLHLAMAFSEDEMRAFEPVLKLLNQEWLNKDYFRPDINDSNTVVIDVTDKYRKSQDLMDGVDAWKFFTEYVGPTFWGGVPPELGDGGGTAPPPSTADYSPIKTYVEGNINAYNGNAVFELTSPSGTLYSFEKGSFNKDSRMKVMSHSKFTTGVVISYLIDKGKLSLNTQVGDIIPTWRKRSKDDHSGITLGQIMGHLSGIPDNLDNEGKDTLEYYVDELVNKAGFTEPGKTFSYSTTAYQVAARMAEIVTGKSWKDLFKEILVDPCEMGDAAYNPTFGDIPGKLLNPLAGYGLVCSEREWMNFISMIRDGGVFKGRRVLNENVLEILKTRTSEGWSDWAVGVMIKDGQYVSEAASGIGTGVLPWEYAWTIFTQASYDSTYWQNVWIRENTLKIYQSKKLVAK